MRREIGYAEDDDRSGYDWALARVIVNDNGHFQILQESGCSCTSPGDSLEGGWCIVGPAATLGGLFDELNVDKDKHPKFVKEAFIDALVTMNNETISAAKSALGL